MTIAAGYTANFKTLQQASANGHLALMECTDAATGKLVVTVCAVGMDNGEYTFTPVARMFDGNPFEELVPPSLAP